MKDALYNSCTKEKPSCVVFFSNSRAHCFLTVLFFYMHIVNILKVLVDRKAVLYFPFLTFDLDKMLFKVECSSITFHNSETSGACLADSTIKLYFKHTLYGT